MVGEIGNLVRFLPPNTRIEHVKAEDSVEESWAIHDEDTGIRVWGDCSEEGLLVALNKYRAERDVWDEEHGEYAFRVETRN
jgi:hypothetical protein